MKRLTLSLAMTSAILSIILGVFSSSFLTHALVGPSGVVISQVQAGSSSGATQEYVSIYNNTDQDIDITNWCVVYTSSSGSSINKPGCIIPHDSQTQIWITARTYTTFASVDFVSAHQGFVPDAAGPFVAGLSDTSGILTLKDATGSEQDKFTWTSKANTGMVYSRKQTDVALVLQDTDQSTDFAQAPLVTPSTTGLYEIVLPLDLCSNIDGIQEVLPLGYLQDKQGQCQQDACLNIDDLQITVPDGYESLDEENCTLVPLESAVLFITELLPNSASYDTGKEFIEIYNPNSRDVSLNGYELQVGPAYSKNYKLPNIIIKSGQYIALSDTVTGIVLPNSSASLKLIAPNGNSSSMSGEYLNPLDDESWALIDDVWQFTNQVTQGSANLKRNIEGGRGGGDEEVTPVFAPCPAGKYRNPTTNRCRNIETVVTGLSPCDEEEYRNPETNRCRKVVSTLAASSLTPCKEGQERNPVTNRCRNIVTVSDSDLKPCEADEERNPETNRCRKKTSGLVSPAVSQISPKSSSILSVNKIMLLVGMFATVGYGLWEYRTDLHNLWIRAVRKSHK